MKDAHTPPPLPRDDPCAAPRAPNQRLLRRRKKRELYVKMRADMLRFLVAKRLRCRKCMSYDLAPIPWPRPGVKCKRCGQAWSVLGGMDHMSPILLDETDE
jgi:hypothetical protein